MCYLVVSNSGVTNALIKDHLPLRYDRLMCKGVNGCRPTGLDIQDGKDLAHRTENW